FFQSNKYNTFEEKIVKRMDKIRHPCLTSTVVLNHSGEWFRTTVEVRQGCLRLPFILTALIALA
ncbi:MAG: hypothetical protein AB2693_21090, partial [Candidatus Thiodiazotropha sp.]